MRKNVVREARSRDVPQTDLVADYFISRPNQLFSPTEVANALNLNQNTVTTIINRLTKEGTILREERGKYKYPSSLDPDIFTRAYDRIYAIIKKAIGMQVTYDVMGLADASFDPSSPLQSIERLKNALTETFGKDTATHLIIVTLKKEFGDMAEDVLMAIGVM